MSIARTLRNKIILSLALLFTFMLGFLSGKMITYGVTNKSTVEDNADSTCIEYLKQYKSDPVTVAKKKIERVDFSNIPEAKKYYSRITEGVKTGPNYAGHFNVIGWGCGTDCIGFAILDSNTGKIIHYEPGIEEGNGISYNINSRILIHNPAEDFEHLKGKSYQEIVEFDEYAARKSREYFEIFESEDGWISLYKVCTESALEGLVRESF